MSGEVFPRWGPRSNVSRGEVAFYEALKRGLPKGWKAWHSLRVKVGPRWEGEGDFVIAAPRRGILVVEVKSGRIRLDDGIWYQNDHRLKKAPRDQAQGYVRLLDKAIRGRDAAAPPWGVAVAFPNCDFSAPPRSGDLDGLVFGEHDLEDIDHKLRDVIGRAIPRETMPRSNAWLDVLHELWGDTWAPSVTLTDRVERAEERLVALNEDQMLILDYAQNNERALVTGGAGTGKSVIARELCVRKARTGERVRYLCFTDALATAVDCGFAEERKRGHDIQAQSICRFALTLLNKAGLTPPPGEEFWSMVSLTAACDALPSEDECPALTVIDEAQDLEDSDWCLIEHLAAGRALWIFQDPRQAFWHNLGVPARLVDGMARLELIRQQRNPLAIARLAAAYAEHAPVPVARENVDEGSARVVVCSEKELLQTVRKEVNALLDQGIDAEDIAVLTLAGQQKSALLLEGIGGGHTLVRADAREASTAIVADTFLRFKGLDRPFIILTELARGRISQYEKRMYIAITRAMVGLTIVCTPQALVNDPRLAALVKSDDV